MRLFAAATGFCLLAAAPLFAQEVPGDVRTLFPVGTDACYAASTAATDKKPGQKLTEFYLYRSYEPNPALEEIDMTRDEAAAWFAKPQSGHWIDVLARFSDNPFTYTQSVSCWTRSDTKKVMCGVDCDGGSFNFTRRGTGIELGFEEDSGGLSLNQSCGEPDDDTASRWMTPEDAGKTITLSPQQASTCIALDRAAKPSFAADPVSLRERIATSGWRCLKRSYDKTHLAKHPKQRVTALAIAIKGPATLDRPKEDYPSTLLDVSLSYRLRDGSVKSKDVQCSASQYEFACETFRLRRRDASTALLVAGEYTDTENPPTMLETRLGTDDRLFRLDAGTETECRVE